MIQKILKTTTNLFFKFVYYLFIIEYQQSYNFICRVILSKVLTGGSEAGQLYATQFLIVGMRSMQEGFERWGLELLVSQLYDPSKSISMIALTLLTEATYHKVFIFIKECFFFFILN